ncbi:Hypothetical predicted protein, partial [Podarcis lilfordi]
RFRPLFANADFATVIYALATSRPSYRCAFHPGSHLKSFQKITLLNKATACWKMKYFGEAYVRSSVQ